MVRRLANAAFSRSDWLLAYLHRATSGGLHSIAGLHPIEFDCGIENVDVTHVVPGHLAYRALTPLVLGELGFKTTADYFDEPESLDQVPERDVVFDLEAEAPPPPPKSKMSGFKNMFFRKNAREDKTAAALSAAVKTTATEANTSEYDEDDEEPENGRPKSWSGAPQPAVADARSVQSRPVSPVKREAPRATEPLQAEANEAVPAKAADNAPAKDPEAVLAAPEPAMAAKAVDASTAPAKAVEETAASTEPTQAAPAISEPAAPEPSTAEPLPTSADAKEDDKAEPAPAEPASADVVEPAPATPAAPQPAALGPAEPAMAPAPEPSEPANTTLAAPSNPKNTLSPVVAAANHYGLSSDEAKRLASQFSGMSFASEPSADDAWDPPSLAIPPSLPQPTHQRGRMDRTDTLPGAEDDADLPAWAAENPWG